VGKRRGAAPAIYDARVYGGRRDRLRSNFAAANLLADVYVGRNIKGKKLSDRPVMLAISRRENIPQALSFRSQAWCVRASLIEIDADADLSKRS